jgi:HK97 family phage portal protein
LARQNPLARAFRALALTRKTAPASLYPQTGYGSWTHVLLGGNRAGRNLTLNESERLTLGNFGIARAATLRIAEDIAALQARVETRDSQGKWKAVPEHPLQTLIDRPKPWLSGHDLRQTLTQHAVLLGRFALLIQDGTGGLPEELDVLYPHHLEALPHEVRFIGAYRYRTLAGKLTYFNPFDPLQRSIDGLSVLEVRIPDPGNPYAGNSTVQAAGNSINLSAEIHAFSRYYFANNAVPGLMLESEKSYPGPDAARAMRDEWNEGYQGAINAGKAAFLWEGLSAKVLAPAFKELAFPELARATTDDILTLFGVPASILGATRTGSLAGNAADAERKAYQQFTLDPHRRRLQAALNRLAERYGPGVRVVIESPVEADLIQEEKDRRARYMAGIISRKEYRAEAGLPDDGQPDVYAVPSGIRFVTSISDAAQPAQPVAQALPSGDERARAARYRSLFAAERKRLDESGAITPELEASFQAAWEREGGTQLAERAATVRSFALNKADPITAYEALKSDGARILARETT